MCVHDSYKEQSEGSTDAEDLIDASEQADDAASQDESDAETIEKVIRHRIGRKGGRCCVISNVLTYVKQKNWCLFPVFHMQNIITHVAYSFMNISLNVETEYRKTATLCTLTCCHILIMPYMLCKHFTFFDNKGGLFPQCYL